MIKKMTVLEYEDGYKSRVSSINSETDLITDTLTDFCSDSFMNSWITDETSLEVEGNCTLLIKKDNKMVFQYLYDDNNPPYTVECSRESFISLFDQWNKERKRNKRFIILKLNEDNTFNLYATDKKPEGYPFDSVQSDFKIPDTPTFAEDFFYNQEKEELVAIEGFHHDYLEKVVNEFKHLDGVPLIVLSRENGIAGTYKLIFEGHKTDIPKSFFPSTWTREQVMEKIIEAYEYAEEHNITSIEDKQGNLFFDGTTKEGITIQIIMNKNTMITAYPII